MRSSRLYSLPLPTALLLTALLLWGAGTQHRVRQLEAELGELRPRIARIDSGYRGATHDIERHLGELATFSERGQAELQGAIARTKELVDAYANEMRAQDSNAEVRVAEARAVLATLRARVAPDADTLREKLLAPTVQLNGDATVGSGTLIWSGYNPKSGNTESYVLTAWHVVRNILEAAPRALEDGIPITVYTPTDKVLVQGDMVAHEAPIDAALVKLRTTRQWPNVAGVLAKPKASLVRVSDPIYAAGCPLGNDPILTRGEISALTNPVRGGNYWMLTAPTYYGNSGGGIYLADTLELIGVFSKIYTTGQTVVSHMGLCTPIDAVHEWLEHAGFAFVLEQAPVIPAREVAGPATLEPRPDTANPPRDNPLLSAR